MSPLLARQFCFSRALSRLLAEAVDMGFEVTVGDAYSQERFGVHRKGSKHFDRLAIDLNLFRNGVYLTKTCDHADLGLFWESIGGVWGGRFGDGNHYEWS